MELSKSSIFLLLVFMGMWYAFWNVIGPVQSGMSGILNPNQAFITFILSFPFLVGFIISDIFKKEVGQWLCLTGMILCLVLAPTVLSIKDRAQSGHSAAYVHDNPIQVEEAVKLLLTGHNPYGQDYSQTDMKNYGYGPWFYDLIGTKPPQTYFINPALFHLVSLPFGFIVMLPFWLSWYSVFGWFDARLVYLLAFIGSIILGNILIEKKVRLDFTILFALNPFLAGYVIEGRNDVLTIFLLLAVLVLYVKKKFAFSGIVLGLAIATKQSAWVFALIYFIHLFFSWGISHLKKIIKLAFITGATSLLLIIPFFLWNPTAFIDDTFKYISGSSEFSYPIKGYGFSMLLVNIGWIQNTLSPYGAAIYQFIFGLPVLGLTIYFLKKHPDLKTVLVGFSLLLLTYLFFARFFLENYFGVIVAFLILSYFMPKTHQHEA